MIFLDHQHAINDRKRWVDIVVGVSGDGPAGENVRAQRRVFPAELIAAVGALVDDVADVTVGRFGSQIDTGVEELIVIVKGIVGRGTDVARRKSRDANAGGACRNEKISRCRAGGAVAKTGLRCDDVL